MPRKTKKSMMAVVRAAMAGRSTKKQRAAIAAEVERRLTRGQSELRRLKARAEVFLFLEKNPDARKVRRKMADIIDRGAKAGREVTLAAAYREAISTKRKNPRQKR